MFCYYRQHNKHLLNFLFFFFVILEFELRTFALSHSTSPFLWRVFWDKVSQTICLGWLRTAVLLISTSWIVRITDVSHQRLANFLGDKFLRVDYLISLVKYWFLKRILLICGANWEIFLIFKTQKYWQN
jgi:hypothetical protein